MPDGTSRQRLGRIGASLVFVEGHVRAIKTQLMGNEKRENWADTIIFQLKRLSLLLARIFWIYTNPFVLLSQTPAQ